MKTEASHTAGGSADWHSHCGGQHGGPLKAKNKSCHTIQQSRSWAYTQTKLQSGKIHARLSPQRYSQQPRGGSNLSVHWQMNGYKRWDMYIIMGYYSVVKKNEIMPSAATRMDLEITLLSEVSQKDSHTRWCHLYVESKLQYKWTYLQNRRTHRGQTGVAEGPEGQGGAGSLGLADANYYIYRMVKKQGLTV